GRRGGGRDRRAGRHPARDGLRHGPGLCVRRADVRGRVPRLGRQRRPRGEVGGLRGAWPPFGSLLRFGALLASVRTLMTQGFDSFFMAGFECSSHRRKDGVRLDLIKATAHDKHVLRDYRLCAEHGFRTLRDGLRWHLIGKAAGKYDWSSWLPALEAA